MDPYKITLILQKVFNFSLLIQKKNNSISRRIAYFYFYTEIKSYK